MSEKVWGRMLFLCDAVLCLSKGFGEQLLSSLAREFSNVELSSYLDSWKSDCMRKRDSNPRTSRTQRRSDEAATAF